MVNKVRSNSAGRVSVACCLPAGVILETYAPHTEYEPVLGGGSREVTRFRSTGMKVKIRGWNSDTKERFNKNTPMPSQPGGFALTHGIDAEFWETWCEQHHDSPLLKNRLLFAHGDASELPRMQKDAPPKTGLEPLDPAHPPVDLARVKPADSDTKQGM